MEKTQTLLHVTKAIWYLTMLSKTYRGENIASLTHGGRKTGTQHIEEWN